MAANHPKHVPLLLVGWCAVGVCLALGVSQLGLFTVPAGVILFVVLARRSTGRERLAIPIGVGAVGVAIGLINLGYQPCPSNGTLVLAPGQTTVSCGGFDGLPWLIVGALLMLGSAVTYATLVIRANQPRL